MRQQAECGAVGKSLIDTAQFRKLVEIDAEPVDDAEESTGEDRESGQHRDDLLVITARLPQLEMPDPEWLYEYEVNPGFDPYNSTQAS